MFFRPEEAHIASGESDVIPPLFGRDAEMDEARITGEAAILYTEEDGLVAVGTGGVDVGILAEHGGDTQRVPDAVGPPGEIPGRDGIVGGDGREGMGHEDLWAVASEDEHMVLGEAQEGSLDLLGRELKFCGELSRGGGLAGLDEMLEDGVADG